MAFVDTVVFKLSFTISNCFDWVGVIRSVTIFDIYHDGTKKVAEKQELKTWYFDYATYLVLIKEKELLHGNTTITPLLKDSKTIK